jgi:hypothetical protein
MNIDMHTCVFVSAYAFLNVVFQNYASICIYIRVYYIYIYIHTHSHTDNFIQTSICSLIFAKLWMYVCMYARAQRHTNTHMHVGILICIHTLARTYIR